MQYYFNTLRKMNFGEMKISQTLRLFKFNYLSGRILKKEYKYLVKMFFKTKNNKGRKNY